jgi:hypothetical protein
MRLKNVSADAEIIRLHSGKGTKVMYCSLEKNREKARKRKKKERKVGKKNNTYRAK